MRIMCDAYLNESASLGSPGLDNIRWSKPVRPGDTLEVEREILESRVSNSKPDIGIVKTRWIVTNQDGEVVMTMEGFGMFRRRHPGRAN
jgi:acyl dehydratase